MAVTLAAVAIGLVASQVSGSPAMLAFALENIVDALSSGICLWRWWGGGSLLLPEDELEGRERRASAAIAIAFVVLGMVVVVNAALHLRGGEEVDHHDLLSGVAAPSSCIFLLLGAVKVHIGRRSATAREHCTRQHCAPSAVARDASIAHPPLPGGRAHLQMRARPPLLRQDRVGVDA